MAIGFATYPGVKQVQGCSYTRSLGVRPDVALLTIPPQPIFPATHGTLTFVYGSTKVPLPDCKINMVSTSRTPGSPQLWTLQLFDRRWKWAYGEINGHYNLRRDDESIDTTTEKTPRELAILCLQAMGEQSFDVSQLPNDARPLTEWVCATPAQALEDLCDALGCRVALKWNNTVQIVRLGVGKDLPTLKGLEHADSGSLDPADVPDSLRIVFGPTRVQAGFILEAVGLDVDGKIKPINSLSYKPAAGWGSEIPGEFFGVEDDGSDASQGDQSKNPRELAKRTVLRWYRVHGMLGSDFIVKLNQQLGADFGFAFDRIDQFLPLYPDMLDVDPATGRNRSPYLQGVFDQSYGFGAPTNTGPTTHYLRPWRLLPEKGIVETQDYVYKAVNSGNAASLIEAADLYLAASFPVRHQSTNSEYRKRITVPVPGPKAGTQPKILRAEEVSQTLRFNYNAAGTITSVTANNQQLSQEAQILLNAALAEYQVQNPREKVYAAIVPIDTDGAIQQVSFECGAGRRTLTRASRNNELTLKVQPYKERRALARLRQERDRQQLRDANRQNQLRNRNRGGA